MERWRSRAGRLCTLQSVHRKLYTVHCAPYTVHLTLCTVQWTPYIVHRTLYTLHCAPSTVHLTLCTIHCTPYIVHRTLYTLHCAPYTVHLTLRTVYCSVSHIACCRQGGRFTITPWATEITNAVKNCTTLESTAEYCISLQCTAFVVPLWSALHSSVIVGWSRGQKSQSV